MNKCCGRRQPSHRTRVELSLIHICWFTFVLSGYRGADLRQVLGGQLTTNYTGTIGLSPIPLVNANGGTPAPFFLGTGIDNVAGTLSGFALLGCNVNPGAGTCPSGNVAVAPEHGVRAYGGFAELGLPLSRWFNANPKGYNACLLYTSRCV